MAYFTRAELEQLVPARELVKALDADEGAFDRLAAAADRAVDAYLAGRYALPLSEVPAAVKDAALAFGAELAWQRRGLARDLNPWTERAAAARRHLEKIAAGDVPLSPSAPPAGGGGAAIVEPARATGSAGGLIA